MNIIYFQKLIPIILWTRVCFSYEQFTENSARINYGSEEFVFFLQNLQIL